MATIITFGNFKGGVGKTTTTVITSFLLQQKKHKVLVIDFDPQADSTEMLCRTFQHSLGKFTSVYEAMGQYDLSKGIVTLSPYLDLIPSGEDLADFNDLLIDATKGKPKEFKDFFLQKLIEQIEEKYDFIIIDVPPTSSSFSNNALLASDYIIPIMQTEEFSFRQSKNFIDRVRTLKEIHKDSPYFKTNLEVLGVICYLENTKSRIDMRIVKDAEKELKDLLFKTHIYRRERVKRFARTGITDLDFHDKRVLKMYHDVVKEIIKRAGI